MSDASKAKALDNLLIDLSVLRDCVKQVHWFIPAGTQFFGIHKLFDLLYDGDSADGGYIALDQLRDNIAEQIGRLGGIATAPQDFGKLTIIKRIPDKSNKLDAWLNTIADNYSIMKSRCLATLKEVSSDTTASGRVGEVIQTLDYGLMYFGKMGITPKTYKINS